MYTAKRRRTDSWVLYSPDTMDADEAQVDHAGTRADGGLPQPAVAVVEPAGA